VRICTTIKEQILYEHRPSEAWFLIYGLLTIKEIFRLSTSSFHTGNAGDRLLGPYFLPPRLTGRCVTISYKMSFQSCCMMLLCRLGFIYGSCLMVLHYIFFLQFGTRVSGKLGSAMWNNSMACSFLWFKPFTSTFLSRRSRWPRGLRRGSAAARLLGLRFRIPPGAWMSVSCDCCVLSGRGLCDGLITRPGEF
jgi:hypothetical protein